MDARFEFSYLVCGKLKKIKRLEGGVSRYGSATMRLYGGGCEDARGWVVGGVGLGCRCSKVDASSCARRVPGCRNSRAILRLGRHNYGL